MLLVSLLVTACAPAASKTSASATAMPPPPPTAGPGTPTSVTGTPLPAFSDWRVAYIGPDLHIHAVSLDGTTDVAGAALPLPVNGVDATGVWAAGTSPDGKHLAYFAEARGQVAVFNAASGVGMVVNNVKPEESGIVWSPDQHNIALDATGYVECIETGNGSTLTVPPLKSNDLGPTFLVSQPFGWLDVTHVAVQDLLASSTSAASLRSLDVATGALRPIATLPIDHVGQFTVEPGGAFTLFWNGQYQSDPFTPAVDRINNATGAVTRLPHLTSLLPAFGFSQVLWRPGTSQALAATGFAQNGDLNYYLIDVAQDTATPLAVSGFPVAWSPDGDTLIAAVGTQLDMANAQGFKDVGVIGSGPYTLTALTVDRQGTVQHSVALTTHAQTIPVLGFIRTA